MQPQPITHGLIGKKLVHSFSKKYFNEKFRKEHIPAAYELFEIQSIKEFPDLWIKHPKLRALNVTIPYKEEVIPYLNKVLPEAAAIGAVNCIKRTADGLLGYNSDLWGFHADMSDFLRGTDKLEGAMILGTGGAARAVAYALTHLFQIPNVVCLSRRGGRTFMGLPVHSYGDAVNLPKKNWNLLVNTTPLGMYPNVLDAPDIPYEQFANRQYSYVYDLVYNPETTRFMELAKQHGAHVRNGMGMLIGQAEKAWDFWTMPI